MQPSVIISELDGQLGIVPSTSTRALAVVGCSTGGVLNQPTPLATVDGIATAFGGGPMPEAAALAIGQGVPVLCVRAAAGASDFGSVSALFDVVADGASTSTLGVTAPDATNYPTDDLYVVFEIVKGGTVGTDGITYRYSVNGGGEWSPIIALGTDTSAVLANAGSVEVTLAAGNVTAGDSISFTTTAPTFTISSLGDAFDALALSNINWEIVEVVGALDPTGAAAVESAIAAMRAKDRRHSWIGSARQQEQYDGTTGPESAATYIADISAAFTAFTTKQGGLTAGDGYLISGLTGLEQRRPLAWLYAPITQAASEEIDVADVNRGSLPFRITDINGNPEVACYNETLYPGLSDAGFVTARTWAAGPAGVYINLPLLKSAAGSDYDIHPMRRVMDLAQDAAYQFFVRRLNQPVQVDKATGKLKESARMAMQSAAQATQESVLLAKPKASAVTVTVSDQDNVLSTKTIHVTIKIVPLAYPTTIVVTMGFENPALTVQVA